MMAYLSHHRDQVDDLYQEAQVRYLHYLYYPDNDKLPEQLIKIAPSQYRVVVVDLRDYRLYLYRIEQGEIKLARDLYVSTGKKGALKRVEGDRKTPLGVYFVSGRIDASALPDFYGYGAFPINYPNAWDRRLNRTGYGIWLHGVPTATYSRPPQASDGCIALTNDDLRSIWSEIDIGVTPVIISDGIKWTTPAQLASDRANFMAVFESWRNDWQSRDIDRYIANYSREFQSPGHHYQFWLRHKRRVNGSKRYIAVDTGEVSIFAYPSESSMRVVTFSQDYRSDSDRKKSRKRQYWRQESDGQWRIIYEAEI